MDETISLFGNPRFNEVVSASKINEYCKRDILEETLDPHGLWGGDSNQCMEIYLWMVFMRRRVNKWLLNVDLIIYWISSSVTNFKCRQRSHIQEIDLLLNTFMSLGEFLITIIKKPFFSTFLHPEFRQMLDRSGSRSWKDWRSLGNHISEWNKSGFGALLIHDLVLHQLIQP